MFMEAQRWNPLGIAMINDPSHRIPLAIIIAVSILATAGSTKITYGAISMWALLSQDGFGEIFNTQLVKIMLGAALLIFAVALLFRRRWARWPLVASTGGAFCFDGAIALGWLGVAPSQTSSTSSVYALLILISYAVAASLVMTHRVKEYLQQSATL
jgi:preprotein translocase subunit SecF